MNWAKAAVEPVALLASVLQPPKIVFLRLTSKTVSDPNAASEFYGWVLAHYAVRWLMHSAGSAHDVAPGRLSFVANVQLLKRAQPQSGAFPPSAPATA